MHSNPKQREREREREREKKTTGELARFVEIPSFHVFHHQVPATDGVQTLISARAVTYRCRGLKASKQRNAKQNKKKKPNAH